MIISHIFRPLRRGQPLYDGRYFNVSFIGRFHHMYIIASLPPSLSLSLPFSLSLPPQDWIISQDPVGSMLPNQWEDQVFEVSRTIEPKDQPPKKVVCMLLCTMYMCVCTSVQLVYYFSSNFMNFVVNHFPLPLLPLPCPSQDSLNLILSRQTQEATV